MKLYLIVAAAVLFAFLSNDFGLVDIQKTAVILAVGVDRVEEEFEMTAQIAIPKGTDRTTGGTSSVEISGKGVTVAECVAEVYAKTGWVPKFVFCDLVLIGETLAKENVFSALDFFLRNEYMPENCLLAVCEGSAKEILSSQSAIDDTSSLALAKVFSNEAVKSGQTVTNTLRQFHIDYRSVSQSGYAPFVRTVKQEGAQTPSGEQASGGEDGKQVVYQATETALFSQGVMTGLLSPNETFAFHLVQGNVFAGVLTLPNEDNPLSISILKNDGNASLKMKPSPTALLNVDLQVRLTNRGAPSSMKDLAKNVLSPEMQETASALVKEYLLSLWQTCQDCECDLFLLTRSLYRNSPKQYQALKEGFFRSLNVEINSKVQTAK